MYGYMALPQPGPLLISMLCVTMEGQADVWGLGHIAIHGVLGPPCSWVILIQEAYIII